MMAAAGKLATKMKKMQIPDVDPVSILYQDLSTKVFHYVELMLKKDGVKSFYALHIGLIYPQLCQITMAPLGRPIMSMLS